MGACLSENRKKRFIGDKFERENSSFSIRLAPIPTFIVCNFQKPKSRAVEPQRGKSLLVSFLEKGVITAVQETI